MTSTAVSDKTTIRKALTVFSSGTLLSRILGLTRDIVLSALFRPWQTDVWIVAFRIPNLFRSILGESAISMSVVPILSRTMQDSPREKFNSVINSVFTVFLLILIAFTVTGVIFSTEITSILVPDFSNSAEKMELTTRLTRLMFPYILLIGMTALFMGILNTAGHFFSTAIHPVFLSISLIIFAITAAYFNPAVNALAYAVIIGGIIQMLFQLPFMKKLAVLPKFTLRLEAKELLSMGKLLLPSLLSASIVPITVMVNTYFASSVGNGVVSYIFWADRLVQFPLGVFAVSLGTAILPVLSRVSDNRAKLQDNFSYTFKICVFILLPATIGLLALSTPIVKVLFQHGNFAWTDTLGTSKALFFLSLTLIPSGIIRITVPLYYSVRDSLRPALFSLAGLTVNTVMCFMTVKALGIAGIALSISVASITNATLLITFFSVKHGKMRLLNKPFVIKLVTISILTFITTYLISSIRDWQKPDLIINDMLHLGWAISSGFIFFIAASYLVNIRKNISSN
ncbi:MAG: murein biosynthesis integral membrane protein MurJ [Oligoflexia bacterium]|nr:murein biosynthesis integral membrane protein MurJ [Oligoflexia bacterium]